MGAGGSRGRWHWREWLSEFAATAVLLLVMVTTFRVLFGAGSPLARMVPSAGGRLVVGALVSGVTVGLLIVSPFGRRSGGHMNPAVSVAFWVMGALPGRDTAAYVAVQLAGSVAGVTVGRLLWGPRVAEHAVGYATIRAAGGMPVAVVFVSEAVATVVMLAAVTFVAARPRLASWLPAVAGAAVAALIMLVGRWTGGSFNPARQFGPELFSGDLSWLWVYLTAPVSAAWLFGQVRSRIPTAPPLACALCEQPVPAPALRTRSAVR
jgi:glycerol uptake facilitator-like aquaporin